jgi:hypothetical protein
MTTNNSITLTACEAAKVLGLAPSTLAKLRLSGNGPVYCKLGRRVGYRREDLEGVARIACCTQHLGRCSCASQTVERPPPNNSDGPSPGGGLGWRISIPQPGCCPVRLLGTD